MKTPALFRSSILSTALILAFSNHLQAQPTLTLSSATAPPGGSAALNLSLSSPTSSPAAVQWTLSYPASSVGGLTVAAGPALSSAGKTVSCLAATGSYTCVASGLNSNTISNGVVAILSVTPSGSNAVPINITTSLAASPAGDAIAVTGTGGTVTVAAGITSIACSPGTLAPSNSSNCIVVLSGTGGGTIGLSSTANLTVPASLTIPSGSSSGTFPATAIAFTSDQTATVTATLNGSSKPATLSLVAPVTISALQCAAASLTSNASTTCTVTLSKSTTSSTLVTLSTSGTSVLTVPPSVSVAANATSATFPVVAGALVLDQTATVTATLNSSSKPATLSLVAPVTISALQCAAASLVSNASTTCTITLSKAGPAGGVAVSLSSSLPSLLTVPQTVTVPASAASATFNASAATITASQSAVISAALGTANFTATISLVAPASTKPLSLSCTPTALTPGGSGTCVISLAAAAASPTVVQLKSTNPAFKIAASLTIPAGATTASVGFTTTSALSGWLILTATSGSASATFTFSVQAKNSPAMTDLVSLSCTKRITSGLSGVCELRVSPSGTLETAAIAITSSSSRLRVPETLLVDPGQTTIRFEVAADPEATEESAILQAGTGAKTIRDSLAIVSSGPHLAAPGRVAGVPATAVRFHVSTTGAITAAGLPPASTFDANTGTFEWIPAARDVGEHEISFTATDAQEARTGRTVVVYIGTGEPVVTQLRNVAGGAVCSPGAIAAVSGWFLSRVDTSVTDRSGRSDHLGETRVLVNGVYAPILSASALLVEFLCPALPARTPLDIAVETPSGRSTFLQTTMEEAAPAILTVDGSPQGQALAIRSMSSELAALPDFRWRASPALSGELISVWATGIDCATSPRTWLNVVGRPVAIDSAEPASQNAGMCQLAFRIPANVAGDSISFVIETMRSDGTISDSNRTSVAVRRGDL